MRSRSLSPSVPPLRALCLALIAGALPVLAGSDWQTDFAAAKTAAKKDNKAILLDFTGSDWCGWCIKMKKDSLDQKAFLEFADKKLVLVEVDFPNKKKQSDAVKQQNEDLQKRYNVEGYPTFVLVDGDGKELGRHVGYLKGGPSAFVQKIEGWTKAGSAK
ncbi:MAG: thioredoxin family protein [Verrucomicrobium sp.]|jgi:thioredoxin-related protein|nr:thioredoxin family protein [Verrucomicrobium sp.]